MKASKPGDMHFTHERPAADNPLGPLYKFHELKAMGLQPAPKGGITRVIIWLGEGMYVVGEAFCTPDDVYCKKTGRDIALDRAAAAVTTSFFQALERYGLKDITLEFFRAVGIDDLMV